MQYFHRYCFLFVTIYNQAFVAFKFFVTKVNFVTKEPRFGRFLEKKFIFRHYSILLVMKSHFITKIMKCKTIIIFSDERIFVTKEPRFVQIFRDKIHISLL